MVEPERAGPAPRAPRGDLRRQLLDLAVDIVGQHGPEAMSLREVQRRAGVSAAAAYRHYRDREALLRAVGRRASGLLADHLQGAVDEPGPGDPVREAPPAPEVGAAWARLRRGCAAYVDFAHREPHLFSAALLAGERLDELTQPEGALRGAAGRGPYQILQDCLLDLAQRGEVSAGDLAWSDTAVWSATHGFAVLMLDGPLRHLDDAQRTAALERLLDVVLGGLATAPGDRWTGPRSGPTG